MALPRQLTREESDRVERIRTQTTYLTIVLGILALAIVFFLLTEPIELGGILALIAMVSGFFFLKLARDFPEKRAAGAPAAMKNTYQTFIITFVMSWLSILVFRGFLAPIEILGIGIVLAALFLMVQIQGDARRIAVAGDVGGQPHEQPAAPRPAAAELTPRAEPTARAERPANERPPTEILREIGQLRDAGVLTDEEFQAKKAELLKRF
jgi:hypothetical protein